MAGTAGAAEAEAVGAPSPPPSVSRHVAAAQGQPAAAGAASRDTFEQRMAGVAPLQLCKASSAKPPPRGAGVATALGHAQRCRAALVLTRGRVSFFPPPQMLVRHSGGHSGPSPVRKMPAAWKSGKAAQLCSDSSLCHQPLLLRFATEVLLAVASLVLPEDPVRALPPDPSCPGPPFSV